MQLQSIQNKIYEIGEQKVMLDFDLAELYEVQTKNLNLAVKRNIKRFPVDFMFQLTKNEWDSLRLQIETSKSTNFQYSFHPPVHGILFPQQMSRASYRLPLTEYP